MTDRVNDDEVESIVVDGFADMSGVSVVGVYRHGSYGARTMGPRSDLDLLVVTDRSLGEAARRAVTALLLDVSGRRARRGRPARPVELTGVVVDDVQPWRYPPVADFQYGEWMRDELVGGAVPQRRDDPDLTLLIHSVLTCASSVSGPTPSAVLPAIPHADLLSASRSGVPHLLADLDDDTTNVLLTLARAARLVERGDLVGKPDAASWAADVLAGASVRDALRHARSVHLGADEDWSRRLPAARQVARQLADIAQRRP